MYKYLMLLSMFCMFVHIAFSQGFTASEKQEIVNAEILKISQKNKSLFESSREFVTGKLYYPKGNSYNHPYFNSYNWGAGRIFSQGLIYEVDLLKYDIESDKLIYMFDNESDAYPVAMESRFVESFEIDGHKFVYLENLKEDIGTSGTPGYYEHIYAGKANFYVKWRKNESTNPTTQKKEYTPWNMLILEVGGKYHKIRSEGNIAKNLSGFESEVRSYIKKNKLTISKSNYSNIHNILSYYDNL